MWTKRLGRVWDRVWEAVRPGFKEIIILVLLVTILVPIIISAMLSTRRVRSMLGDYMLNFYALSSADYVTLIQNSLEVTENTAQVEAYAYSEEMYMRNTSRASAESNLLSYGLASLSLNELHSTIYLIASHGDIYRASTDTAGSVNITSNSSASNSSAEGEDIVFRVAWYSKGNDTTYHYMSRTVVTSFAELTLVSEMPGLDFDEPELGTPAEGSGWASLIKTKYPQYVFFEPVRAKNGTSLGMVSMSYMLSTLRSFMATLPVNSDTTFVVDILSEGVIASKDNVLAGERPVRLARAQCEIALDAAVKIVERFGS